MVTALDVAAAVPDPELRVVSIADLGILRDVTVHNGQVSVTITPTYSGCPAMDTIRSDVDSALRRAGYSDVQVRVVLDPAWTTDWITPGGRAKLAAAGVAPPHLAPADGRVALALSHRCPQCGSPDTAELSRFGATPCKALWRCRACMEPFEAVKTI
jgi:ring-1,2-phenylacetyl-CoA epoxidase subunit PaaD